MMVIHYKAFDNVQSVNRVPDSTSGGIRAGVKVTAKGQFDEMLLSGVFIAVGAVIQWSANAQGSGFRLYPFGMILMIVGAMGFVGSSIVMLAQRGSRRSSHRSLDRLAGDPPMDPVEDRVGDREVMDANATSVRTPGLPRERGFITHPHPAMAQRTRRPVASR